MFFLLVETIIFVTPLKDVILKEVGINGVFETEISKSGMKAEWFKGDVQLRRGDKYDMMSEGCKHSLTVEDAQVKDEGQFKVQFNDVTAEAKLIIHGKMK